MSLSSVYFAAPLAFREASLSSTEKGFGAWPRGSAGWARDPWGGYSSLGARMSRYEILWSYYENTSYASAVHRWAQAYKHDYALYENISNLLSCGYPLGEFWAVHLLGGAIDPRAGDGTTVPSALPIDADREGLRPAIARLLKDSTFAREKDTWARHGAVLGDAALRGVDDADAGVVRLLVTDPRRVTHFDLDSRGHCRSYEYQEHRGDPRPGAPPGATVRYVEQATKLGDAVQYRTYLDEIPFAWDGRAAAWTAPYPFVPFWWTRHNHVGLPCGFAEAFPILSKFRALDNLSSPLVDFVLKSVDAPWLFAGVRKPADDPFEIARTKPSADDPRGGAYEVPALYAEAGASATALVSGLDIDACRELIGSIVDMVNVHYPELVPEVKLAAGDASGKALRYARARTEAKAHARRVGYDSTLTLAIQGMIAVGGFRGYEGYEGYGFDSYKSGALDFRIGERSVYQKDPQDDLEQKELFWKVAESAVRSGMPLEEYLRDAGWAEGRITRFLSSRDKEDQRLMKQMKMQQSLKAPNPTRGRPDQAPVNGEAAKAAVQTPKGAKSFA